MLGTERFIDGGFSDPIPIARALTNETELLVAVTNRSDFSVAKSFRMLGYAYQVLTGSKAQLASNYEAQIRGNVRLLTDPRVVVISPSRSLPLRTGIDTDRVRLNTTIDLGIADAQKVLAAFG